MTIDASSLSLPATSSDVAGRRAELFRETPVEVLQRWALGTAWSLKRQRIGGLPAMTRLWLSELLAPRSGLPNPETALATPVGMCGIVRDMQPETLHQAYRQGLFPFAHFGPLKWYAPPQRCVLHFDELHIAKRLRREMRQSQYRVSFDRDFEGVIKACAGRRTGKWHLTWITPRIMRAYTALFDAGDAHSFEVWNADGALVGGGYGLAVGNTFFTESQFSLESNTSKIGFTVLNWHLAHWGFRLNDGKWQTPTILDMGFRDIPRAQFRAELDRGSDTAPGPRRWHVETDLATVAAWIPAAAAKKSAA